MTRCDICKEQADEEYAEVEAKMSEPMGANDTAAQTDKEKDLQAAKKPTCEDCGVFLPCKPTEHREGCSMHIRNGVSLPVGSRDFEDLLGKVLASRGISQNVPEWAERLAEDISNYTD